ncbi:MAG: putative hemolysin [Syntrophales bacterium]
MKRVKKIIFIGITGVLLFSDIFIRHAVSSENIQIANPASVYCVQSGYTLEIRANAGGGEYGVCIFPDGNECEEWAFFRNECGARYRDLPDDNSNGEGTPEKD